jgi:hypothetical protein
MRSKTYFISGTPVTFATQREAQWKGRIYSQLPASQLENRESGMILEFALPTLAPQGQPLDVDNLCEPVFSVAVNRLRWFGGRRPHMKWWDASKSVGKEPGCRVVFTPDQIPQMPEESPLWDEVFQGELPRSARSIPVAVWAWTIRSRASVQWIPTSATLFIGFGGSTVNLGDVATGPVKSFMDCLYPWLGGGPGYPEDHRVSRLIVAKGWPGIPLGCTVVKLWAHGQTPRELPRMPREADYSVAVSPITGEDSQMANSIRNPCRKGSAKWIVCEAALSQKPVADVRRQLDDLKQGSGSRLSEYVSDLRSENRLNISIEGGVLVCHGYRS